MIWALYLCACGYERRVKVRVDQRVTVAHDCPSVIHSVDEIVDNVVDNRTDELNLAR